MTVKKSALSAKNLKKVSSPGPVASELQTKADKSGTPKIAYLEWDFSKDPALQDVEIEITGRIQNMWKVGAVITHLVVAVDETLEDTGATLILSDYTLPDQYWAVGAIDHVAGTHSYNTYFNDNLLNHQYYANVPNKARMRLKASLGDITFGKVKFWFTYLD